MCLITKNEKQIATEDITCYKILNGENYSSVWGFKYEFGKKYEDVISESNDWCVVDTPAGERLEDEMRMEPLWKGKEQLPSFQYCSTQLYDYGFRCYGRGFHSFASLNRAEMYGPIRREKIVRCIIPAGAEYIQDNNECIISNQIIVVEDIK